ncbi:4'-phosphopantetheinyl transferase superfamily protein [Parapedobacter sp. 2B3]|uniref:4'-phosphopantetheinyl transferase family protein n=1 Tax=Parapedobacter sp. 2B3 TaxID=3342381 RepID=UPI0035B6712D
MKHTSIISTWMEEPRWTDGWPVLRGSHEVTLPSVWLVDAARAHAMLDDRYNQILSSDEVGRAERFHQPAHRIRYKASHTVLRMLLAGITHADAATLRFVGGHHNKPKLTDYQRPSITFNLSHTEHTSMIAVADGAGIGADIEWIRRPIVIDDMLAACFSANEIDYITSRPEEGMRDRFFTLWTRKEAILKLTGEGIGEHLPLFEVLDGTCVAEKEIIGGTPPDRIYLYSFRLADDYVGCFATAEPTDLRSVYRL